MFRFKLFYLLIAVSTICFVYNIQSKDNNIIPINISEMGTETKSPVSFQTYHLIEKYSHEYDVPKHIAYNILYMETAYQGPFHWEYNPYLTSSAGAVGAMQIKPSTASWVMGKTINKEELRTNLDLNISIGMKLLNKLYLTHKDWLTVCSYYNTGYKEINDYALFCVNNKEYSKNWKNY